MPLEVEIINQMIFHHLTTFMGGLLRVPSSFENELLNILISYISDRQVLFAENILKFPGAGKIKRRILLITDLAIYILDLDRLCLNELSDNFLAIIIPSEYDCLLASTHKTKIVTVLVEATKNKSNYGIEVVFSNRADQGLSCGFEYYAAANNIKEVQFEEVDDGGARTRMAKKSAN
ncbi:hypothetical protein AMTRI_Chr07g30290 [Amborella trichopoda]